MKKTFESFTFSSKFVFLSLIALGLLILTSALDFGLISIFTPIFWLSFSYLVFLTIKKDGKKIFGTDHLTGWALFLAFSGIAYYWLHDLYALPSNDDTIAHLAFVESILRSGNVLVGKIIRPGAEFFGNETYHFYPTGSHSLLALFFPTIHSMKLAMVALLGLWPGFLWWSSFRLFPTLNYWARLFLVVGASTASVFPFNALGEGGFSRIAAMILFVPIWFEVLAGIPAIAGFLYTACAMPILLFIHPELLPLIGVSVLFLPKKSLLSAIVGMGFGGFFFYLIIHSAPIEVTSPEVLGKLISSINPSWFDRMKGPVHYWFADSFGIGKFLSPKNYLIFFGLALIITRKLSPKILFLFLVPFAVAALALIPTGATHQLGLIFYHSVKRISELTPLLGFTIGGYAAAKLKLDHKLLKPVLTIFCALFIIVFTKKSGAGLQVYHDLFHSPRIDQVNAELVKLRKIPEGSILIIDDHQKDIFRFALPNRDVFTLFPECTEHGLETPYCKKRFQFIESVKNGEVKTSREIWWINSDSELSRVL